MAKVKKRKAVLLPEEGIPREDVLKMMDDIQAAGDVKWKQGRAFGYVYHADDAHYEFLKKAHNKFFSENALSPLAFPSLKKFEAEVASMAADLLGGDRKAQGSMTSGGTESNMMAVKTYREWARDKLSHIKEPEIVMPESAHPSLNKACHYFGVKAVMVPVGSDYRADVKKMEAAITDNTIAMVGSAIEYTRGVVDPIPELAAIAKERGIGFHTDSCLGGYMLPFLKKLGYDIPDFDLSVPGVTSISADLHKYGFTAKGASTILWKNQKYWKYQFYAFVDWPGGVYVAPSMGGTRPGSIIAAAWAAMKSLGMSGYMKIAKTAMETTKKIQEGINAIPGLDVIAKPVMTVFSFGSETIPMYSLGDMMEAKGWIMDRMQKPQSLHLIVNPLHAKIVDDYLETLAACVEEIKKDPPNDEGKSAIYGLVATMPDRKVVKDTVIGFLMNEYKV
ncbi:MAG: pyridoxal phosphate-dependent decarboxylase family protein [Promethearchaeota archaeon]